MMEDICAHIMDIVANSLSAGAKNISISFTKDSKKSQLAFSVKDDGKGMDSEMAMKVQDPFFSTKTGRKVGLGIPLLKGTAETTGGSFSLKSVPGQGTEISVSLDTSHPDLPPVGKLKDLILILMVGNPEVDFLFDYDADGKKFTLDTKEIKQLLEGIAVNHPEVIVFLDKYLGENM